MADPSSRPSGGLCNVQLAAISALANAEGSRVDMRPNNLTDLSPCVATKARSTPNTWLFVLPWDLHHPGGVNQVVESLFDANARVLGNRSLLLINSWKTSRPRIVEVDGRRTCYGHSRSPLHSSRPFHNALAFLVGFPATLARLRRLLKSEGVVRVNVHYPDLDALIWLAVRRMVATRPPLILSFHGTDLNMAAASTGVARRLWHKLLGGADEIVFCSQQLRTDFERAFGQLPHVRVIDNGVDPELLVHKATAAPSIELPPKCILSLATFENNKGLDVLLRAFDLLAERDVEVHLVIAGRVTHVNVFERIEAQRQQLRHGDRVRLLQDLVHAEAMRLLRHARIFVLASRQEAFGIVVLEAGALGRPVVATSACGVSRRLSIGTDLLVVPPDNAAALADAIERVLADDALALRLGASLRQRVHAEFTWARIVHQYAALGAA